MTKNIWLNSSIGICITIVVLMTFSSINCFVRDNLNDNNYVKFVEDRTIFGGEPPPIFGEGEPAMPEELIPPFPILLRKVFDIIVSAILNVLGFVNDSYGMIILSNEFISFINGTNNRVCV